MTTQPASRARTTTPEALPLAPFLASLGCCGIYPTLRDHQRIHTLLESRCRWTRPAFLDALAALLTSDRDQQVAFVFVRHYNHTFDLEGDQQDTDTDQQELDVHGPWPTCAHCWNDQFHHRLRRHCRRTTNSRSGPKRK